MTFRSRRVKSTIWFFASEGFATPCHSGPCCGNRVNRYSGQIMKRGTPLVRIPGINLTCTSYDTNYDTSDILLHFPVLWRVRKRAISSTGHTTAFGRTGSIGSGNYLRIGTGVYSSGVGLPASPSIPARLPATLLRPDLHSGLSSAGVSAIAGLCAIHDAVCTGSGLCAIRAAVCTGSGLCAEWLL